jgi:hypothetical protein
MEQALRKTIDELIARYTLEPELRDLYVEGPTDKLFFEWFFKQFGCLSVSIFEIDCVDIQDELIERLGLQSRNRDEVIALSIEFERSLQNDVPWLFCVADSDFDFLLGRTHNSRYLLYTDYTSIDLYFWSEDVLEKCFQLGVRRVPCDIKKLLANFAEILQEVFLIRAANESVGWNLHWIDFTRCCCIKNNLVVFDRDEFIRRYLCSNSRQGSTKQFIGVCERLRKIKVKIFKHRIRGGDFFELVGWYISKQIGRRGNKYRDPEVIRAVIVPAVDVKLLTNEELFKKLLETYGD